MISVIIRARDEARWIGHCLRAIHRQSVAEPYEIILVDNNSQDETIEKALSISPAIRVVSCTDPYRPGAAINLGAEAARGESLILLSAHCVASNEKWMTSLVSAVRRDGIAGAYGRQIPFGFSRPADKRDLWQLFGLDRRIQTRDGFFHNANSIVRKEVWQAIPFDEQAPHVEDLLWGEQVIGRGYKLAYEPEACVYHHHGINHHDSGERCESTVRVLESLPHRYPAGRSGLDPARFDVVAVITAREPVSSRDDFDGAALRASIDALRSAALVSEVIVSTESGRIAQVAVAAGASVPFMREPALASADIRVDAVLVDAAERLAEAGRFPDVIVAAEHLPPERPEGLIDCMVQKLVAEDLDTVVPALAEKRPCWVYDSGGKLRRYDQYDVELEHRRPVYIGVPALACAVRPDVLIKYRGRFGPKLGIIVIDGIQTVGPLRPGLELIPLNSWQH